MNSQPDMIIPSNSSVPIALTGQVIIQAKSGAVYVANTGAAIGEGFKLAVGDNFTFAVEPDGLQVSNSTGFPVTIALIQL